MAVYFIEDENKFIKIGYSETPIERLENLQTGNRQQLILLAVIPGDKETEQRLHKIFAHLHERGDWFRQDQSLEIIAKAARVLYGLGETQRLIQAERIRGMAKANVPVRDIRWLIPESGNFSTDWIERERLNGDSEHIKRLLALPLSQKDVA